MPWPGYKRVIRDIYLPDNSSLKTGIPDDLNIGGDKNIDRACPIRARPLGLSKLQ